MEHPPSPDPDHSAAANGNAAPNLAWWCVACVAIALALRLPWLGDSLWFDEACMCKQRIGTFEQLLATIYVDIDPPLFSTFMHLWNSCFGDSELSLRLPSLLAALLSIPALLWTGRRLVGERATAWAMLLLALSPVHIWYATEARMYAPMVLCTLLFVGSFDRLIDDRPGHRGLLWIVHLGTALLLLLLHYYLAVLVVLFAMLAPVAARGFTNTARRLLIVHGLGIMLLSGFLAAKHALGEFQISQEHMRRLDHFELYRFLIDWCWSGNTLAAVDNAVVRGAAWLQSGLGVVLLLAGTWQVLRSYRQRRRGLLVPICMLTIPVFLICVAAMGKPQVYIERSCISSLPFVLLLAAAGLTALPRLLRNGAAVLLLLISAASLVALFQYRDSIWTVYRPRSDWRAASAYLAAEIEDGAAGRPVFSSTPNPRPLSYYDARVQDVANLTAGTTPQRIGAKVRQHLGEWFGAFAERSFAAIIAENERRLQATRLRVYRSTSDPAGLELGNRGKDDICYLVRDSWHPDPRIDHTIEDLLVHRTVTVLEKQQFTGLTVYKVRIAR